MVNNQIPDLRKPFKKTKKLTRASLFDSAFLKNVQNKIIVEKVKINLD